MQISDAAHHRPSWYGGCSHEFWHMDFKSILSRTFDFIHFVVLGIKGYGKGAPILPYIQHHGFHLIALFAGNSIWLPINTSNVIFCGAKINSTDSDILSRNVLHWCSKTNLHKQKGYRNNQSQNLIPHFTHSFYSSTHLNHYILTHYILTFRKKILHKTKSLRIRIPL